MEGAFHQGGPPPSVIVEDPCPALKVLDVSNNEAGFFSHRRVERANEHRQLPIPFLDLEGNMILEEVNKFNRIYKSQHSTTLLPRRPNAASHRPTAQVLNVVTHGAGCVASIVGTPFLLKRAWRVGDEVNFKALFPACFVYCMSSIACYLSSSLYHSTFKLGPARHICHIADQVSYTYPGRG